MKGRPVISHETAPDDSDDPRHHKLPRASTCRPNTRRRRRLSTLLRKSKLQDFQVVDFRGGISSRHHDETTNQYSTPLHDKPDVMDLRTHSPDLKRKPSVFLHAPLTLPVETK
ncbi:unnamed protein product [Brassica napus]|uniref:(rape) hypothetical protein n=1 Tax=Brassica napus TaxID=3708 RepID=A0A816IE68_BRANA|nr:unnamed protein product [Brassica napus]